jgi:hypothetical protein
VIREVDVPVTTGAAIAIGEYWRPAAPGTHAVACEVNPDRAVPEAVYADNVRQRSVTVHPAGAQPAPPTGAPSAAAPPPAEPRAAPAPPPAPGAKPDLAILAATTVADPGCGPRETTVTVRVTLQNVGLAPFVPPRGAALLEVTARVAPGTTITGRKAVPPLPPGASAEVEVVARDRGPAPDAGGARYSVVVIVNGDRKVEEETLDNNGEYVKAVFPPC